ncbi:hypothetical protein ACFLRO_00535 [Bacteroidota bacterium]
MLLVVKWWESAFISQDIDPAKSYSTAAERAYTRKKKLRDFVDPIPMFQFEVRRNFAGVIELSHLNSAILV